MQNTRKHPWIRNGGSGCSKFARSGATSLYVRAPDESGMQTDSVQTSPPDQKAPRIVSRLHTLENESKICRQAFLPGEHLTIPPLPNVTAVNVLGDFSIARDRLAIIDGEGASRSLASKVVILHRPRFRVVAFLAPTYPVYTCVRHITPSPFTLLFPTFVRPTLRMIRSRSCSCLPDHTIPFSTPVAHLFRY